MGLRGHLETGVQFVNDYLTDEEYTAIVNGR